MTTICTPTAPATPLTLRYLPIPQDVVDRARRTLRDDFGHLLHVRSAQGPCRSCLRIPAEPDEMILLSYRPLSDRSPYAEVGPVFVHARPCAAYASADTFPADFTGRELVLRAYDDNGEIADALIAGPGDAPRLAAQLLRDPSVAEVHVRHTTYTCFDFTIVRG